MNLSHPVIKKSLKRVDSDCFSVGVLDFSKQKLVVLIGAYSFYWFL